MPRKSIICGNFYGSNSIRLILLFYLHLENTHKPYHLEAHDLLLTFFVNLISRLYNFLKCFMSFYCSSKSIFVFWSYHLEIGQFFYQKTRNSYCFLNGLDYKATTYMKIFNVFGSHMQHLNKRGAGGPEGTCPTQGFLKSGKNSAFCRFLP